MGFIDQEATRLETMESFTTPYVDYLFEELLRVFNSYMAIFWTDNVLDQKAEINTANSFASMDKFAKALFNKLKHFNIEVYEKIYILYDYFDLEISSC